MSLENYQERMIELFIEQEILLYSIYTTFAEKFEAHGEFWKDIANEEKAHAGWLKELRELIDNEEAHFEDSKTRTYTLNTMLEYEKKVLQDAEGGQLNLKQAFARTLELEQSLIERRVLEHFKADSAEVKATLKKLTEATHLHMNKVRSYVNENKVEG